MKKKTSKPSADSTPRRTRASVAIVEHRGSLATPANMFLPEYIQQAYLLCLKHNYQDDQLAEHFNVSKLVFARWLSIYPDLQEACWRGRDYHSASVIEPSLVRRATGYTYKERKVEQFPDGSEKITETEKHVAPNMDAIQFFLLNRLADRWKPPRQIATKEDAPRPGVELDLSKLSAGELATLRGYLEKSTHLQDDTENPDGAIDISPALQSISEDAL